jgi:NAD(P)-dependent dehydrogenase (short-subunit alcohol dehydrogenase family)
MVNRRRPAVFKFAIAEERSMPRLAGRVAFITGAGNGIGRATAILFAREGARVAIAEIDARAGDETAHLAGNETIAIRADVTDPDSLQSAIRATVDKFGRLDVLHNNAGGSTEQDDTAVNAPLDEFWRAIKLDLYGTFIGCRFGIPELIKAGGGSVINMSSNVALMGVAGRDCYTAAKGGIAAITRSLAVAYAPRRRLCPTKSSRQCDCAISDDDRAGQETRGGKRRADPARRLASARPDRARRYRQHGALSCQ